MEEFSKMERMEPETLNLTIHTITGQYLNVDAQPSDSVMDVKTEIQARYGIPTDCQILMYNNQVLKNHSRLRSSSINMDCTLRLALHMQDGTRFDRVQRIKAAGNSYVLLCKRDTKYFLVEVLIEDDDKYTIQSIKPLDVGYLSEHILGLSLDGSPSHSRDKMRQSSSDESIDEAGKSMKPSYSTDSDSSSGRYMAPSRSEESVSERKRRNLPRDCDLESYPSSSASNSRFTSSRAKHRSERSLGPPPAQTSSHSLTKATPTWDATPRSKPRAPSSSLSLPKISDGTSSVSKNLGPEPPGPNTTQKIRNVCSHCRLKLRLTNAFKCKCGATFCPRHRFSDQHDCTFDFRQRHSK